MYLKEIPITRILVSPVIRTIETAKIVCEILGSTYEIDERLYEIELGKLVGMNYEEIVQKYGNLFLKFYSGNDPTLISYGVESFTSVKNRINNLLEELGHKCEDENVLLITHLDPIKAAVSILLDLNPKSLYRWHIRNASLTILRQESQIYSLSAVNLMSINRYFEE
jgi:probable phosphoglycerate mutase